MKPEDPCAFGFMPIRYQTRSVQHVIERWRVRVPADAVGEPSFPGSTFCGDSCFGIRFKLVLPQQKAKDSFRPGIIVMVD